MAWPWEAVTGVGRAAAAGAALLAVALRLGPANAQEPAAAAPATRQEIEQLNRMLRERQRRAAPQQEPVASEGAGPEPAAPTPAAPRKPATTTRRAPAPSGTAAPSRDPGAPVDEDALREAIERLGDEDPRVRDAAMRELVTAKAAAVPPLLDALEDPEERIRAGAVEALGEIRDPRAAAPLVAMLGDAPRRTWDALWSALHSLRHAAAPELVAALDDSDSKVRWRAVALMGGIRDGSFTEPLIDLLNRDRSTGVRLKIAWALGRIRDRRATEALLDTLHDWWPYVAKSAVGALEEITGQRFGRDEDAWRRWWREEGDAFLAGSRP